MSVQTPAQSPADTDYLRNANLIDLHDALQDLRTRALDVVAPASLIRVEAGAIVLDGLPEQPCGEPEIPGVPASAPHADVNGLYKPTGVADEGFSTKLDIPRAYLRRCRTTNIEAYDANVNGWLRHVSNQDAKLMLRMLVGTDGFPGADGFDGVCRAVLSSSYKSIDSFDVLMAALTGMRDGGVVEPIITADLTERRMVVRVTAPGIAVHAPELLKGYNSPFGGQPVGGGWTPDRVARAAGIEGKGYEPGQEPIVFAGFVLSNSETGGGAWELTPRLVVRVCANGLTITADALRKVHLGARLDAGVVRWSADTQRKVIALVTAQTRDAVTSFLNRDYVSAKVAELEAAAGAPVKDATKTVETVSKSLGFTQAEAASVLDFFVQGGQLTAGGVVQAITATAQTLTGDAAFDMEQKALQALTLCGRGQR